MTYGVDYSTRTLSGKLDPSMKPEPLHCGSCGQTVLELQPCTWDPDLEVGECCLVHPDEQETGCTLEGIYDDPTCTSCGHRKSEHRPGGAYGLESYACDVYGCGCGEVSYRSTPRVQRRPVQSSSPETQPKKEIA